MRFHADLHMHSRYAYACSRNSDLEQLTWWARRKGVTLMGTGDFTHPAWLERLRTALVPAEPGLFRLREDLDREVSRTLPGSVATAPVRYMLTVEVSTVYRQGGRSRKIHHLVHLPGFEQVEAFNRVLAGIADLGVDGRPTVRMSARDLLETTLARGEGAYLVPAHVWTPWFGVFGSKSGFDTLEECFGDLTEHVFALETGLSADPGMMWQVSGLDGYRLVSYSDAHSPPIVGRETTVFDTGLDYFAVLEALRSGDGLAGTTEFFPEAGKYHVDGHRKCGVRLDPEETRKLGGICPVCGRTLTVGVQSRVEDLADRPADRSPRGAAGFRNLLPLPDVVAEILGVGPKSKKVAAETDRLVAALGPELAILGDLPLSDIAADSPRLAEAVGRLRNGEVTKDPGYDGEFGRIHTLDPVASEPGGGQR
ncbi:endonuclease Q family protein [Microbispora triticiradicis]|uniref:DNA helicase UvrD n=2 Tax=Microbispora TaxID=2005 RepID=A0ABY3M1Q4_9ACTN|nr:MULTISPECIES: endonuclease Q family protein [Microbispora]TLP52899.1 DNA helicase UvrD [Microbispora fusca]TYB62976.1 DNA helicase UvrD [Microbispora tritici]